MKKAPLTITAVRKAYLDGTLSPSALLAEYRAVIKERDADIHAYLEVFDDADLSAQAALERLRAEGDKAPLLCGIPVAMKNNILIQGKRTTAGSRILENYIAPYDATVTRKLKEAGAVLIGATNLDEFAMGSSTENSAFGVTKNPIDTTRVPGGSSGGSAAAVAMGSAVVSLGTDTGGSIREPASFCGLVGLKPTYGRVSRYGLVAMGSSLDQAGPMTHTVTDAEIVFNTIAGEDGKDGTMYAKGTYVEVPPKETYRIGVPEGFLKDMEPDVKAVFDAACEKLSALGHEIVPVSLPYMAKGLAAYYIVMPAEVSSNLARYDGVRFGLHVDGENLLGDYKKTRAAGFGHEVQRRILLGAYVLSAGYYDAYYGTAEGIRDLMRAEFASAFSNVDLILTPTAPMPAFKIGEKSDPLSMYLADVFTVPANLTGVPALSVPGGSVLRDGISLPIGVQFMAPHDGEARLFDIGKRFLGEG